VLTQERPKTVLKCVECGGECTGDTTTCDEEGNDQPVCDDSQECIARIEAQRAQPKPKPVW